MGLGPAIELEAITQALLMNSDDFAEFYAAGATGGRGVDGPVSELINSPDLAAPTGFSHAVRAGDTVYLAGQTRRRPTDRSSGRRSSSSSTSPPGT